MLRARSSTIVRPWTNAAISGFIVDPDRKKMSKSKGNVVTPARHPRASTAPTRVRYWAASSRLGTDAAFDPQNPTQIKIGRRLAIKVLNAAKFVARRSRRARWRRGHRRARPRRCSRRSTASSARRRGRSTAYDHARALEVTETFFWTFCDDYLELVKERALRRAGCRRRPRPPLALRTALATLLRLFAPVLAVRDRGGVVVVNDGSVHTRRVARADSGIGGDPAVLSAVGAALIGIRRAKTEAKASQKTPVTRMTIAAPSASVALMQLAEGDLSAVGRIDEITYADAEATAVSGIELAQQEV